MKMHINIMLLMIRKWHGGKLWWNPLQPLNRRLGGRHSQCKHF